MRDARDEEVLSEADGERLMAEIASSLEAALRVQPSADFLARVRGRIVEESARAAVPWPDWLSRVAAPGLVVLAVIVATVVGREAGVSEPGPTPARSVASVASPPTVPLTITTPLAPKARSARHPATPRAPGVPVVVEAGQLEALARMAARVQPDAGLRPFAVESLEAAPLPELRAGDLPRFEAKRLTVGSDGWQEQEAGGPAPDGNEGSGS